MNSYCPTSLRENHLIPHSTRLQFTRGNPLALLTHLGMVRDFHYPMDFRTMRRE